VKLRFTPNFFESPISFGEWLFHKVWKVSGLRSQVGTEVLQYKTDLFVPKPNDGEILVKNDFCGVNYIDMFVASTLSFSAPLSLSTVSKR